MTSGELNLRQIDLNLLVALHALLDERSVTGAADRLGLSQPAMSRMLARLRLVFDDPLLVRMGREMVPTPRAQAVAGPLRHLLAEAKELIRPDHFDPAAVADTVRIMASDAATEAVAAPWAAAVTADAPGLRFDIVPLTVDVETALARGTVDFAIDVFPDPAESCRVRHVFVDRFACVVRAGHPILAEGLTPEAYAALDHIAVTETGAFLTVLEPDLARLGVRRSIKFYTTSMAMAPFVASQTDWIATVPSARARRSVKRFGVEMLPLPYPVRDFPLSVLWHERTDASPLHRWMLGRLPTVEMPG